MLLAILVGVTIINVVLGLLVFIRRPNKLESIAFLASIFFMAMWAVGVYATDANLSLDFNLWMVRLAYFGAYNIMLSLLLFTIFLIGDRSSFLFRYSGFIGLIGGLISLVTFSSLVVPYVVPASHGGVDEGIGVLKIPYLIITLIFTFAILYAVRQSTKLARTAPRTKAQLRLVLFGIVAGFLSAFVLNALVPIITDSYAIAKVGPISVIFMTVFISIAMIKHRLFDIRLVVARSLAYVLSLLILTLAYITLAFGLINILFRGNQPTIEQQVVYVVLALLLAITFTPLKRVFDKLTRKVFYRSGYDTQEVLDHVGSILVRTVDLGKLRDDTTQAIDSAIKPIQRTAIVLSSEYSEISKKEISRVIRLSERQGSVILTDELQEYMPDLYARLRKNSKAIIAPMKASEEVVGYLMLSDKASGSVYDSQDAKLIKIIADELAVAIQNSLRFEEIQQFNETLQDKVDAATERLRRANARLKQLDATKDEFVSMASHQLRTPLTSIKGYLSMVLEGDAGKLNPTQDKLLREAFTSSERMVRLIGDFLNVSRLRTGRFGLERKTVNIADLVESEVSQLQPTAATRELKLVYEKPTQIPDMDLDKGKIQQVVMNLIDNAIFYSEPKNNIIIELFKNGNDIIFRVKDKGIGVPANEKKRLFTKFYRASNARKQRPDGTGIGLFMAQKVILAHGGSIIFESTEDKGSTFGFRLPIKISQEEAERAEAMAGKDTTPME